MSLIDGEDAEADKNRLNDLLRLQSKTYSVDIQTAVASTAVAFLRKDMPNAKKRLEALQKMELSEDAEAREANASLWLVACYALKHDSTRSFGEALAERTLTVAQALSTPVIKDAILRERSDVDATLWKPPTISS